MNVKETFRTLMCLPPRKSVLIEGRHGIGKSQVVAQVAAAMSVKYNKPFGFVDIRLGQYEVGDLIGLPCREETFTVTNKVYKNGSLADEEIVAHNITVHELPLWFPKDKDSCGFLFFDELNRGSRDTQQWAFQCVLDYRVNFHDIPEGWRVVSACNDDQDLYSVLNLDPALYSRFLVIKFRPTVPEWLEHAEKSGVHDAVIKYIRKFSGDLDSPEKMESGKRYQDRRSWFSLSDVLNYSNKVHGEDLLADQNYLILLAKGYLGETVAINFSEYIRKDYKVFTAEEILNNFPKYEDEFKKMIVTDIAFYNKELVDFMKKSKAKLTKKQSENLLLYFKCIPKETASGFWSEFSKDCREKANEWYRTDPGIAKYIMDEIFDRENAHKIK